VLRKWHVVGSIIIAVSLIAVLSISAQESQIPAWVKGVANFWVEGNISDNEFGEAITFLIEQKIIRVVMPNTSEDSALKNKINQLESEKADLQKKITSLKQQKSKLQSDLSNLQKSSGYNTKSAEGFSNLNCNRDGNFVKLTGKYTNGEISHDYIFFILGVIGDDGSVLATGSGALSDVGAHETRIFSAMAKYSGIFKTCEIEVSTAFQ